MDLSMKTKIAIAALSVLALVGCDKLQGKPEAKAQRYQIVFNPNVRADTFLLDTEKGKVWQLVKFGSLEGQPTAWDSMDIIDNSGEIGMTYNDFRGGFTAANPTGKSPK